MVGAPRNLHNYWDMDDLLLPYLQARLGRVVIDEKTWPKRPGAVSSMTTRPSLASSHDSLNCLGRVGVEECMLGKVLGNAIVSRE